MRALLPLAIAATLLFASVPAAAQDPDGEPGCPEGNPCEFFFAVDASGIADISTQEFTTGDWLLATVFNDDEVAHTVRLSGHSFELAIAAGDIEDSEPFRLGSPGTYTLSDDPSGDTVTITVHEEDEFGGDAGDGDDERGSPALSALLLLGALALALAARRR